jgi:hypothetical protein
MSKQGFYAAQEGHVVPILYPQTISGGVTAKPFNLMGNDHASIVISFGAKVAAETAILINAGTNEAMAVSAAIAFDLYKGETSGSNVTDTGSATAYAVAALGGITAPVSGQEVVFTAVNANSGTSATLAINGGSAKALKNVGVTALTIGQIAANSTVTVIYDGTEWIIQPVNPPADVLLPNSTLNSGRFAVTAAGYAPPATSDIFYIIEIEAAQLPPGSPYVQLQITNGANANYASAIAILSGGRNTSDQSLTVIV